MSQKIYRAGCWSCLRTREDEKYICPKLQQHWAEYKKHEEKW